MAAAKLAAQELLHGLTGNRLGVCEVTESYRVPSFGACGPFKDSAGHWQNGRQMAECCGVALAQRPVQSIVEVVEYGRLLGAGEYGLERGVLMRRGQCWRSAGSGCDDGSIDVTYRWGVPLDSASPLGAAAGLAMGELTKEFVEAMCGRACRLPSRAASVSRQGVQVTMMSPQEWIDSGLVGLPLTDALIRTANPNRQYARSQVYSPRMARRVR